MLDVQGEIGVGGNYIVNEQGRADHVANTMPAPYYEFDGTITDTIVCGNDDSVKVGSGDFSGFAWIKRNGTLLFPTIQRTHTLMNLITTFLKEIR